MIWFVRPSHAFSTVAVKAFGALTCGDVRPTTVAPSPVPAAVIARSRNVMPPCWFNMPVTVYEVADDGSDESITIDAVQLTVVQ